MKSIITLILTICIVTGLSGISYAEQASCKDWERLATSIMTKRQEGAMMSDMYATAEENEAIEDMIIQAYEQPRYQTEMHKTRIINKFANEYFKACIKYRRNK